MLLKANLETTLSESSLICSYFRLHLRAEEILNHREEIIEQAPIKEKQEIIIEAQLKFQKEDAERIKERMDEYRKARMEKQPIDMPSAGSTFKRGTNYISAKLIDDAGLKGYEIGGAQVSEKHAGFIVNKGNATAQDILDLIDYVIKVVYEKFGKILELEVEVIGE